MATLFNTDSVKYSSPAVPYLVVELTLKEEVLDHPRHTNLGLAPISPSRRLERLYNIVSIIEINDRVNI